MINSNNQLIFFDQRGNGQSPYLINNDTININQFTSDIDELRIELGLDKMVILGHSMGTFFAIDYAKKYPQHVSKLILSNPVPINLDHLMKMNDTLNNRLSEISTELDNISTSIEFKSNNSEALKSYLVLLNKKSFVNENKVNNLFEGVNITKEFMDNFKAINNILLTEYVNKIEKYNTDDIITPTLILNTEYDFIPVESSTYILEKLTNSKIETIYNSGHYPFIEKTEDFLIKVNNFLAK